MNLNEYIAHAIVRGRTQKHFSSLMADFLQLEQSNMTNLNEKLTDGLQKDASANSMNTGSPVNVGPIKPVDSKTLAGSYPGDHRAEAQGNTNPLKGNDTAPRAETNDQEGAGA